MESSSIFGAEKMEPNDLKVMKESLRHCMTTKWQRFAPLPIGMKCQENMVVGL